MVRGVGKNSGPRDQGTKAPGTKDPGPSVLWNVLRFIIHSVLVPHTVPVQVTVVNAYHCIINPAPSLSLTMLPLKGPTPQPTINPVLC